LGIRFKIILAPFGSKTSKTKFDKQEEDNKTKNDDIAFLKPHPSGEVWRGLNYN